jgi:signal transduction histidine kinase
LPKRAAGRAQGILAPAMSDPSRLEFLLELSHELRTTAGIIDGYLSLARQGELRIEDAMDVAAIKAKELVALLDELLDGAEQQLGHAESGLRSGRGTQQPRRPRMRRRVGPIQASGGADGERRDHLARAARDSLALAVGLHPRDLGALPLSTVLRLTGELERREAGQRIAEDRRSKDAS